MSNNNLTSTIPAFIGGVSQQSPALRLKTQCDSLVNGHATVGDGLMQRPNADLIDKIGSITAPTGMKTHKINRDVNEKYIVIFTSDTTNPIRVFELDGTEMTVQYGTLDADLDFTADSDVKKYLSDGGITDAKKQIKATTIADYTIVVNAKKTCAAKADVTDSLNGNAYAYFKAAHKGTYNVGFYCTGHSEQENVLASYVDGVLNKSSNSIMNAFKAGGDHSPNQSYWITSGADNVLKVAPNTVDDGSLKIKTQDPFGGQDITPINFQEVDGHDKLPPKMPESVTIKIGGDKDISQDDYYLQYDVDTCIWTESLGFGLKYILDEDTLPHRLVRTAANTFTFAPIIWEDRTVGDNDTNPMPSFIENTIANVTFAKNRLWFLSGQNPVGSKAGDYFNFFGSTVMDVIDDDPIDTAGTGEKVTNFRSAKAFDGGLLLFSDEEQFALTSGENLLTPKTVAIDPTTSYAADPDADPIKLGADVYFVSPKSSYLALRQYTVMPDTLMKDAYDVTSHVSAYIPAGDVMMDGCNQLDILFLHSSAAAKTLWVHKFMWNVDQKVQQAWYKWTFADDIRGIMVFNTVLYILFYNVTDGYILEAMNLENISTGDQDFRYHLDHLKLYDNGSFGNPDTTFTLDVNVGEAGAGWTVVDASDNLEVTTGFTLSGTTLTFADADKSAKEYYVGRDYEMRMRFSEWYMRDKDNNALIAGNLTIRTLTLSFVDTGYFTIEVTPFNRNTTTEIFSDEFSGIKVDESIIGSITLLSGEETFQIVADSRRTVVELATDSYLPAALQLGCWEGTWVYRGKIT